MMANINPYYEAKLLLRDSGFDEITNIDMDLFISGLGPILIEEPLLKCDGKILFGSKVTIIKINSDLKNFYRKRFIAAHEIGHYIMHKNMQLEGDSFMNLNVISGMENLLKNGLQELQANEFASELLMPETAFLKESFGKKFSPKLLNDLSSRFRTSLTSTLFRYIFFSCLHPICVFLIENGKVKFWKKSEDLEVGVIDYTRLSPPKDSVAEEYIENDYLALYDEPQSISKSTWFFVNGYDENSVFYEYCIPMKNFKTILSVVWED